MSTETEVAITVSEADVMELKRGVHTRVLVDKEVFGVKEVILLGVYPGTAEAIDKLLSEVESKSSMQANLDFIKQKNTGAPLKGDPSILSRGTSQIEDDGPERSDGDIGSSVPPSNRNTNATAQVSDLQDYIKGQQGDGNEGQEANESET